MIWREVAFQGATLGVEIQEEKKSCFLSCATTPAGGKQRVRMKFRENWLLSITEIWK